MLYQPYYYSKLPQVLFHEFLLKATGTLLGKGLLFLNSRFNHLLCKEKFSVLLREIMSRNTKKQNMSLAILIYIQRLNLGVIWCKLMMKTVLLGQRISVKLNGACLL